MKIGSVIHCLRVGLWRSQFTIIEPIGFMLFIGDIILADCYLFDFAAQKL